jgi:4-diphosphocytidyl-2-C-methyl-D-erythritol kinase
MNIQEERQAPAKINLLLNILGRGDDGYHELESLMIPIPLYDILHFRLDDSLSDLRLSIPQSQLNPGTDNLVMRAAKAFLKETRMDVGIHIELIKKIPMEAGLGGGSSDAAITLKTLNHCFGKPLSQKTLHTLASQLGSDVPFFLAAS